MISATDQSIEKNYVQETGTGTIVKLNLGQLRCPAPDECFDSRHM